MPPPQLAELKEDILSPVAKKDLPETLKSLQRFYIKAESILIWRADDSPLIFVGTTG